MLAGLGLDPAEAGLEVAGLVRQGVAPVETRCVVVERVAAPDAAVAAPWSSCWAAVARLLVPWATCAAPVAVWAAPEESVAAPAARVLLPWSRVSAPLATWPVESASCWVEDASSSLELASVSALPAELESELWMLVMLWSSWST